MTLRRRIERAEKAAVGATGVFVTEIYDGETEEEAWRLAHGDAPMPDGPGVLHVYLRRFAEERPAVETVK